MFTIAYSYEDMNGKALKLYLRFGRDDKVCHVQRRESATHFFTRGDASAALMKAALLGLKGNYRVESGDGKKQQSE